MSTRDQDSDQLTKIPTTLDQPGIRQLLISLVGVYLVTIAMPWIGDARGWEILFFAEPDSIQTTVTERGFALLGAVCIVLTAITAATKRIVFSMLAWAFGSVALVAALLGLWLRQTGTAAQHGITTGIGFYLAIAVVLIAVPALLIAWTKRTPEQKAAEQLRRERTEFSPVAEVQTDAAKQAIRRTDGAQGIIDDRRARAAERHKKNV